MFLLLLYAGGALAISFLCSLLEATLLSSRVVELVDRRQSGDRGAELLIRLKRERLDDAISAILTLNTVAHTVGAALAGARAEALFGDRSFVGISFVGAFTALFVLAVLLVSEIIPKTLGTVYASRLVGFVAHTTHFLVRALKGPLVVTRALTRLVTRERPPHPGVSRSELAAMVGMATRDGTLPAEASRVMTNVLRYHDIKVEDVMTPRTVITMRPADTTIAALLDDDDCRAFSRLPLYRGTHDNVVGYVLQREVLAAAARGVDRSVPLSRFLRKAPYLPEGQSVARALRRMIEGREHLALVTDEYGGISGLVTLEDLVETTLGMEILDESDRVVDLRAEAARLRQKRLESLREWRDRQDDRSDGGPDE